MGSMELECPIVHAILLGPVAPRPIPTSISLTPKNKVRDQMIMKILNSPL